MAAKMNLKITPSTIGLAAATATAATATVLLGYYLGGGSDASTDVLSEMPEKPTLESFTEASGSLSRATPMVLAGTGTQLKNLFDFTSVNRSDRNKSMLQFQKGSCFDSFFPGANLSRPTKTPDRSSNLNSVVPHDFTLAVDASPIGCKLMKFSEAKEGAGFGYMSETTARGSSYGFAMYAAVTNLKQKFMTSFEYWLMFVEKKGESWSLKDSYFLTWSVGTQAGNIQKPSSFFAKTPDGQELRWSPRETPHETFHKLFEDNRQSGDLWDPSKDKYYAGMWMSKQQNTDHHSPHFFYDGSNEKWALKEMLSKNGDRTIAETFLNKLSLDAEGKWGQFGAYCGDTVAAKDHAAMTVDGMSLCIKGKALGHNGEALSATDS